MTSCRCGHVWMQHDDAGCLAKQGQGFCPCPRDRDDEVANLRAMVEAVERLHHAVEGDVTRCIAANADYDYHQHGERCFVRITKCNGCGVEFSQCSTRRVMQQATTP
jgi:hypothetical protein